MTMRIRRTAMTNVGTVRAGALGGTLGGPISASAHVATDHLNGTGGLLGSLIETALLTGSLGLVALPILSSRRRVAAVKPVRSRRGTSRHARPRRKR